LGDPLKGNLLLFYKPLHLEAQQVSTRIEVRRHQQISALKPNLNNRILYGLGLRVLICAGCFRPSECEKTDHYGLHLSKKTP
jgi:hypothetical protein